MGGHENNVSHALVRIALASSALLIWLEDVLADIEALVCNDLSSV